MPGLVQRPHHRLELQHLFAALPRAGVGGVRGQVGDRVVAPVVGQPPGDHRVLGHELVHRHQLDRGDAQAQQMVDDRRVAQPRVGAALFLGHGGVAHGEAAHMRLVDHGLVVRRAGQPVVAPLEERVDHHVLRHEGGCVVVVAAARIGELVGEQRLVPLQVTLDGLGVGIEEQLGGVGPVPLGRVVGAVEAVAVPLSRDDSGKKPCQTNPSTSGMSMRSSRPSSPKRHSSTRSATSENTEKLVPTPSQVPPSGYGSPGQTSRMWPYSPPVRPSCAACCRSCHPLAGKFEG